MEIVYCGGCGKVLREDDFSKGRARFLDNRPWCSECKPPEKVSVTGTMPAQGARRTGSSAKHPRIIPGTTRRDVAPDSPNRALFMGLGIAGGGVLLLGILFSFGGGTQPPPEPPVARRTTDPLPNPNANSGEAEVLLKDLEAFASLSPPDRILARCEELRARIRGMPQEKRFREIEAAALERKKTREQETQLTRELDALRVLVDSDPRYEKFDEVVRRYRAAKEIAGPRADDLDRRLREYQKARRESPQEKHAGPFLTDDNGFVRNWLVIGVFPSDHDKGIDTDFLGGEGVHDAVSGQEVGKARWAPYVSPEAKVDFFLVPHLGIQRPKDNVIAYAACLVQLPTDVAAEFRVGSDDGAALWVDGTQVGKVHAARKLTPDNDRYAVPLSAGVHRVLLKVENHTKDFEFVLRIVGPDGQRVPSLRVWN